HAEVDFPRTRVTVNLAPADLKKVGTPFDLPIALGVMAAAGSIAEEPLDKVMLAGELGLDGSLRPIHGALSFALLAKARGLEELILPFENAAEAALVEGVRTIGAKHLRDVIRH